MAPPIVQHPRDWRDEWLLSLAGSVSPATVVVYRRSLDQFLDWLEREQPSAVQIRRAHVDAWMAHLTAQGRAAALRSVRLKALSRFFDYVESEGGPPNPCLKVARP